MSFFNDWSTRFPRGLPFGFSPDCASADIRSLHHFGQIDRIAKEAYASEITVVTYDPAGSNIELLSPLIAIGIAKLEEESSRQSAVVKPIIKPATKSKKEKILWDPSKPTAMDGFVTKKTEQRNSNVVLKSALIVPGELQSHTAWDRLSKGYADIDYSFVHVTNRPDLFPDLAVSSKPFSYLPPTDFVVSSYSLFRQLSISRLCSLFISVPSPVYVHAFRRLLPDIHFSLGLGLRIIVLCFWSEENSRSVVKSLFTGYRFPSMISRSDSALFLRLRNKQRKALFWDSVNRICNGQLPPDRLVKPAPSIDSSDEEFLDELQTAMDYVHGRFQGPPPAAVEGCRKRAIQSRVKAAKQMANLVDDDGCETTHSQSRSFSPDTTLVHLTDDDDDEEAYYDDDHDNDPSFDPTNPTVKPTPSKTFRKRSLKKRSPSCANSTSLKRKNRSSSSASNLAESSAGVKRSCVLKFEDDIEESDTVVLPDADTVSRDPIADFLAKYPISASSESIGLCSQPAKDDDSENADIDLDGIVPFGAHFTSQTALAPINSSLKTLLSPFEMPSLSTLGDNKADSIPSLSQLLVSASKTSTTVSSTAGKNPLNQPTSTTARSRITPLFTSSSRIIHSILDMDKVNSSLSLLAPVDDDPLPKAKGRKSKKNDKPAANPPKGRRGRPPTKLHIVANSKRSSKGVDAMKASGDTAKQDSSNIDPYHTASDDATVFSIKDSTGTSNDSAISVVNNATSVVSGAVNLTGETAIPPSNPAASTAPSINPLVADADTGDDDGHDMPDEPSLRDLVKKGWKDIHKVAKMINNRHAGRDLTLVTGSLQTTIDQVQALIDDFYKKINRDRLCYHDSYFIACFIATSHTAINFPFLDIFVI